VERRVCSGKRGGVKGDVTRGRGDVLMAQIEKDRGVQNERGRGRKGIRKEKKTIQVRTGRSAPQQNSRPGKKGEPLGGTNRKMGEPPKK